MDQFSLKDKACTVQWSPDGLFIMCQIKLPKQNLVEVRRIDDKEWSCTIDEGLAGLGYAHWVPDSRQIITITDFQLRLTIWNLCKTEISYIKGPKLTDKGISFTQDGKFMALAERRECKDYVSIYYCGDWQLMNHFQVDTQDMVDLTWAKDDTMIIVWDTPLENKLLIYSATQGLMLKHEPYQNALGYKNVNFSPCGQFLTAGSYDEKVRIYNHVSWKEITQFEHTKYLHEDMKIHIYIEEEYREGGPYNFDGDLTSRYKMQDLPIKLTEPKPTKQQEKEPPLTSSGVEIMEWSHDSKYLATKNDNTPNCVWVWDMTTLELSILLIHFAPVKSMKWSTRSTHLVMCSGSQRIFIWSLSGASVCDIPTDTASFNVQRVEWNPNGQSILVFDKVSASPVLFLFRTHV